jgi:hypothetical protein
MLQIATITNAWQTIHANLHPIQNETEYDKTLEFMRNLMREYNVSENQSKVYGRSLGNTFKPGNKKMNLGCKHHLKDVMHSLFCCANET